jgi:hypothetical protein
VITSFSSDERWDFYKSYVSILIVHQLILVLLSVRRVAGGRLYRWLVDETEPLQLVGRSQERKNWKISNIQKSNP